MPTPCCAPPVSSPLTHVDAPPTRQQTAPQQDSALQTQHPATRTAQHPNKTAHCKRKHKRTVSPPPFCPAGTWRAPCWQQQSCSPWTGQSPCQSTPPRHPSAAGRGRCCLCVGGGGRVDRQGTNQGKGNASRCCSVAVAAAATVAQASVCAHVSVGVGRRSIVCEGLEAGGMRAQQPTHAPEPAQASETDNPAVHSTAKPPFPDLRLFCSLPSPPRTSPT